MQRLRWLALVAGPVMGLLSSMAAPVPARAGLFDVSAVLEFGGPAGNTTVALGSASAVQSVGGGIAEVPGILLSTVSSVDALLGSAGSWSIQGAALGPGFLSGSGGALGVQGSAFLTIMGIDFGPVSLGPIGAGGTASLLFLGIFRLVVEGSPWTTGVVTAMGTGNAAGTLTATGADRRTPGGAGTIQFVSASTFIYVATPVSVPSISRLTLSYSSVPEPAALVPLGAGLGLLIAVGHLARLRRR